MSETVISEASVESLEGAEDRLSLLLRQLAFRAKVFFRAQYCGSWAVDTSGSLQVPFHMVCQGEGWLHGDSHAPRRLVAGQLALFPQDSEHVLASSQERPPTEAVNTALPGPGEGDATQLVCGYFEFDQATAKPFLESLPETMVIDLGQTPSGRLRNLVNLWIEESRETRLGGDLAVDLFAELIFLEMLRAEAEAGRLGGVIGALADRRLGAALHMIHAQPGGQLTAAELAGVAGMSESAFTRRFKEKLGRSVGAYVRDWRMQLAARALIETERSMADIAYEVGYESEVAFRKAFKQHMGSAPGRYRREQAG